MDRHEGTETQRERHNGADGTSRGPAQAAGKNSRIEVQQFYDVHYLPSDFKKGNGYLRSVEMCKEYDVYRQCYCGCMFAAKQQGVDLSQIRREALAFMEGKDGQKEFPEIRFSIDGIEV